MAERVPQPATTPDLGWRTNPAGNTVTDPGPSKRADGWAYKTTPGHDEANWIQKALGDFALWAAAFAPREWEELSEGIVATAERGVFRVIPPAGAMRHRLEEIWKVYDPAGAGGNPWSMCCDGEQIYYRAGASNQKVVAADPTDGAELWTYEPGQQIFAVATDGRYVYCSSNATLPGLNHLRRSDGVWQRQVGVTHSHMHLVANGDKAAGIGGSGGLGVVDIWDVSLPANIGSGSTGSAGLNDLAIDADLVYVGGIRNVNDIWAYNLSDASLAWQVALDTNAVTVHGICADGDCVYVCTDYLALAAGGGANLFCLSRYDGRILWTANVKSGTVHLYNCCVDDQYLYVTDQYGTMIMLRLGGAVPTEIKEHGDIDQMCCDGISIFSPDALNPNYTRRLDAGEPSRIFTRVSGTDPNRRPFYTLAVPAK